MEQKTQQVDQEALLREKAEKMEAERQRRIKRLNESSGMNNKVNVFDSVKTEFEAIAGIVEQSAGWEEVGESNAGK